MNLFSDFSKRPSAVVLIVANLLPLFGVILWGWSMFNIVLIYWVENLVLGVINVLKMITCKSNNDPTRLIEMFMKRRGGAASEAAQAELDKLKESGQLEQMMKMQGPMKLFIIPFFCVHYFFFCAIHGVFVFVLFGKDKAGMGSMGSSPFDLFSDLPQILSGGLVLAVFGLFLSHLYSFFANYLGRGENRRALLPWLMFKPYGRIVLLHVAIIFGGFVVMALGSPIGLLLILIVGKIVMDLALHLREHRDDDEVAGVAEAT